MRQQQERGAAGRARLGSRLPTRILVARSSAARAVAASLTAAALGGCATPEVVYQPYEVRVAVEKPCDMKVPPEPAWATSTGMPRVDPETGENIDVATDKLQAERNQRIAYEKKLKEEIKGCR